MNLWCGTWPQYHIQYFPPSKNPCVFQQWTNKSNFGSIKRKYSKKEEGNVGLKYGAALRLSSNDSTDISTTQNSPRKTVCRTYSKQFNQCNIILAKQVQLQQIQPLRIKKITIYGGLQKYKKEFVERMFRKSQFNLTVQSGTNKWVDQQFLKASTFKDSKGKIYPLQWKRLEYLINKDKDTKFVFIANPIELTNILQGQVGDCYFLSAIAALTDPKMPQRILKMFPEIKINEKGVYKARLMFKGLFQEVLVDDYFPFYKDDNNQVKLLGCRPCKKDSQIYTLVLQKCWAKLCKSYENIDGGYSYTALHVLSGALTKNYDISYQTSSSQDQAVFLKKLQIFCTNKYVMCAGTQTSTTANVIINGLREQINIPAFHIYCVVGIIIEKEQRMVNIYNPWGFNKDKDLNKRLAGQFSIPWTQFKDSFHHITVCKIHDNAHYLCNQLSFKSKQLKFIELTVHQSKTGYFAVSVCQTFHRQQDYKYLNVNFIVLKQIAGGGYQLVTIRSKYRHSDHYLELHNISQGKYLIAIYISDPIKELLTFGVYSEDTFGFIQKTFPRDFTDNFLSRILLEYDSLQRIPEDKIYPRDMNGNGNIWISSSMVGDTRLGYIILSVGKGQQEVELEMSCKSFQQFGLSVLYPYDTPTFKLIAKPGFSSIATVQIKDLKKYEGKQFKDNRQFFRQLSKGPQKWWRDRQLEGQQE